MVAIQNSEASIDLVVSDIFCLDVRNITYLSGGMGRKTREAALLSNFP